MAESNVGGSGGESLKKVTHPANKPSAYSRESGGGTSSKRSQAFALYSLTPEAAGGGGHPLRNPSNSSHFPSSSSSSSKHHPHHHMSRAGGEPVVTARNTGSGCATGSASSDHHHHSHHHHNTSHSSGPAPSNPPGSDELIMLTSPAPSCSINPVMPHHDLESLETCSRNPLLCLVCNSVFEDPRLLTCYHSFCAKCIQGRTGTGETKLSCPLCGKVTPLKEGTGPPPDMLLRFLLQASADIQPPCANCDRKGRPPMYYCNTCGQALCTSCREETHRAKMFSAHDIIPVSKYTKETPKKCSIHGEQFIMFSTVQRTMLCINCYRDTAMESRLHCVDLETAYNQGCRKLDRAILSLRDLQVAVRDGITMLKNVLEELRRNSDSEKSAVNAVVQTILDALTKTQENLMKDVDCQMEGKDKVIRGQLAQLCSVLPTIKLHLAMCATIANAASKYDFLDLAYPLIDRLTAITHMGYPIRPGQSSQIKSIYKAEIGRTLEPWIAGGGVGSSSVGGGNQGVLGYSAGNTTGGGGTCLSSSCNMPKDYSFQVVNLTSMDPTFSEPTYSQYYPMSRSTVTPMPGSNRDGGQQQQSSSGAAPAPTYPSSAPPSQQQQQQQQQQHHQSSSSTLPASKTSGGLVGGGYATPSFSGRKTPIPSYGHHSLPSKIKGGGSISSILMDIEDSFSSHCRSFNAHYHDLSLRLNRLKEQVQDLHRDVTLQRGSQYSSRAEMAIREGMYLEDQLSRRHSEMERLRKLFESSWNEHLRQVRIEQDVFQAQLNDLATLKAEVKQISSILQQIQSFLKSVTGPHGSGGGGSGGGNGATGGGTDPSSAASPNPPPNQINPVNSQPGSYGGGGAQTLQNSASSNRLQQQQHPQSHMTDNNNPQPSLADIAFSKGGSGKSGSKKDSIGYGIKSDLARLSGRFSVSKVSSSSNVPQPGQVQTGSHGGAFIPLASATYHHHHQPHCQLVTSGKQGAGSSGPAQEMEYIQVDTSYGGGGAMHRGSLQSGPHGTPHHHHHQPNRGTKSKHGVLSQLIDKVRSGIDDRKKSCASGVSSCSSSGGPGCLIPPPPPPSCAVPTSGLQGGGPPPPGLGISLLSRKALAMKDSQFQYNGPYPDNSAVTALARSAQPKPVTKAGVGGSVVNLRRHDSARGRDESRPIYTRAKSFVKSKSDDERPPTKLSKHSRARSAGALETESLLKALNLEDPKEALRLLSLYQSLSRGLLASTATADRSRQIHSHPHQSAHHQPPPSSSSPHYHPQHHGHPPNQPHVLPASSPHPHLSQLHQQQLYHAQQQVASAASAHARLYNYMLSDTPKTREASTDPLSLAGPYGAGSGSLKYSRSSSESAGTGRRPGSRTRDDLIDMMSEDDYQQIPFRRDSSTPGGTVSTPNSMSASATTARSHSAPPRRESGGGGKSGGGSSGKEPGVGGPANSSGSGSSSKSNSNNNTTQVKVYVHEEPRRSNSPRSHSSPAPLSKSMEEAYLYGFLDRHHSGGGGGGGNEIYPSSSSGHPTPSAPTLKKPVSCESLISFDSNSKDSRKSSIDFDRRSVVTIRRATSKSTLRQHSWEGSSLNSNGNHKQSLSTPLLSPDEFIDDVLDSPSSSSHNARQNFLPTHSGSMGNIHASSSLKKSRGQGNPLYDDDDDDDYDIDADPLKGGPLRKAESFEGHEEAVRSIVAAVQETRTLQRKKANK